MRSHPLVSSVVLLACLQAAAQPASPPMADAPYPGVIELRVDATDVRRRIVRVHETLPVKAGTLTLYYPQWRPGYHAPSGALKSFAGLKVSGNGRPIPWLRDPLDMHAFRLEVPEEVRMLELEFQYLSSLNASQVPITMTPEILGLQWDTLLLYPAGYQAGSVLVATSLALPADWHYGTALTTEKRTGDTVHFKVATLEELVDSPLFAGRYFSRVDLDPGAKASVYMNLVVDAPDELDIKPELLAAHRKLVRETVRLFGSRHFDRYDFLFAVSDLFGGSGLEHHRSSENALGAGYFKDADRTTTVRTLLPHEFIHSWNGKFRRPVDLWTPQYNVPMQNSLLWVYEGLTSYWATVLTARSGLWTPQMTREFMALRAATLNEKRPGRTWRSLQDTTNQPLIVPHSQAQSLEWMSWQRTEDFYFEAALIWLDVDTKLRELTRERRSLDDFARTFFGVHDGGYEPLTYTRGDVIAALDGIAAFDWDAFLRERVAGHGPGAPLQGLERSGWRLAYAEEPNEFQKKSDSLSGVSDFSFSIGATIDADGRFVEVVWNSPVFKAGVSVACTLVAINGRAYQPELLRAAIVSAQAGNGSIELLVKDFDRYRSVTVDYT